MRHTRGHFVTYLETIRIIKFCAGKLLRFLITANTIQQEKKRNQTEDEQKITYIHKKKTTEQIRMKREKKIASTSFFVV